MLGIRSFTAILGTGAVWAASVALPLASGGCNRTACFVWSAAEGPCPAAAEANPFFGNPDCEGKVVTVDGEGTLNGQLCCYPVTQHDNSFFGECFNSSFGGEGGFIGEGGFGGGFGGGGFGGGFGGGPSCLTCGEALFSSMTLDPSNLCGFSIDLFDAFVTCLCVGACSPSCGDNICVDVPIAMECQTCVQDTSANGCGLEFSDCANDI